jgi:hypothetical protein
MGPNVPDYPQLNQFCRVYAPALLGTNVYPAFVQQFVPPLSSRDRESCYVWEPNGVKLGSGIVDCRLVGSYSGLPLYEAACCLTGVFSSSSSSLSGH